MATSYSPRLVTDGLVHLLEPTYFNGTSSQSLPNKKPSSTWVLTNYSNGTTANTLSLKSNADNTGAGTSFITVSRNSELETGSITFIIWCNLQNIPIDVGGNNNWRGLLCTSNSGTNGSPLTCVLEQGNVLNFSTTHTDLYRRYLNNNFAPMGISSNGWQMVTYTYSSISGTAACYLNSSLIRSGPMTSNTSNGSPTSSGTSLSYTSYSSGGFRIYGGTTTSANPTGNGICPGEVGNIIFYNRALTDAEVLQNYNALKGRFGL